MKKSKYDVLCSQISKALVEYAKSYPNQRISIKLSISTPLEDGKLSINVRDFLGGNVVEEDTKLMIEDARRLDDPPEQLHHDINAIANTGQEKNAIFLAEQIVREYPSNPKSYQWLGEIYGRSNILERGIQTLLEAARLAETEQWLRHHDLTTEIHIRATLAYLYFLSNLQEAGREQLRKAMHKAQQGELSDEIQNISGLIEQLEDEGR